MKIDYKKELNAQQLEAVTNMKGPALVLAGAGSGKTRTLIYRVCYLIEHGVAPCSILLLTFTNKAAHEMQERAEEMLGEKAKQLTACTYHSFCTRMLRKYAFSAGLAKHFTVLGAGEPVTIVQMMMAELGLEEIDGFPPAKRVANIISSSINKGLSIDNIIRNDYPKLLDYGGWFKEIESIKEATDAYKRKNDLLDYDDIMLRFLELLKNRPDVAQAIENMYEYISIDEYQDTNPLQADIIRNIRKENHNLMVVGDDYQSIYGFRGSDVNNILHFPDEYPDTKVIFLTSNYRSTPEIIGLSNELMEHNAVHDRFKKRLISPNPSGMVPAIVMTRDQEKSALMIVENMEKAHEAGRPWKEMCILARSSASTAAVETELVRCKIPYEKRGGVKFFEQTHVCDFIAFLRAYSNSRDELSWFRILRLLKGVGEITARKLASELRDNGLKALLSSEYEKFREELREFGEFFYTLDEALPVKNITGKCKQFYLKKKLEQINNMLPSITETYEAQKQKEAAMTAYARIQKDLELLCSYATQYESIIAFLDNIAFDSSNDSETGRKSSCDDKVVISTVHSSKGLEFESVYILDCVDGCFPGTNREKIGSEEDQEELRCFYVAVTRAKKCLYMFVPAFTNGKFGVMRKNASHYFDELQKSVKVYRKM